MSEKKEFMGLTLLIGAVIGIGAAGRSANNPQTLGVVAVILAVVVAAEYLFFYD
jgi:hypothetical protein